MEGIDGCVSSLTDDNFPAAMERLLERSPSGENRDRVRAYVAEKRANGIKVGTLGVDLSVLGDFCQGLGGRPLESAAKADVVAFLGRTTKKRLFRSVDRDGNATVTQREARLSPHTMARRRQVIRQFFKWLRGTDDYPPEVRGVKASRPRADAIPTDKVLTHDEVRKLLQAHPDPREKAMLAVLYESGLRSGEFRSLKVSSVEFDQYGAALTLPKNAEGLKTGPRRVRLYQKESAQYLHAWFENHPHKDEPGFPLFYSLSRRKPMARLTGSALWQFARRAGAKAGLGKTIHPHLFRHTAATERARQGWTEYDMRHFFGWTRNSDMASHYVHLAGKDYEERDLERRGLKAKGDATRSALSPRVCRVCASENLSTATYCQACRNPVSPEAERDLERRRRTEISDVVAEMLFDMGKHVGAGKPVLVMPHMDPVEGVTGGQLEQMGISHLRRRRAARSGDVTTVRTGARPFLGR